MANEKQLSVERVLYSQSIRRAEQRGVTQTDGLLREVIENRRLYAFGSHALRTYRIKTGLPEHNRVTARVPRPSWTELGTMSLAD
jgi:hypothetical protein